MLKYVMHERDNHIHFEEGPHEYTIKKRKKFKSVTTFIHEQFWPFNPNYVIDKMIKVKVARVRILWNDKRRNKGCLEKKW